MTLTVETGAIVTGANSYISRADAIAYAANRGVTLADTTATDAMLIKATDYLETYAARYRGIPVTRDQPLAWPRWDVTDEDGLYVDSATIPTAIANATCEAALRIIAGTDLDPDRDRGGRIKSESVGSLSVVYADGAPSGTTYPRIDRMVSGLVAGRSSMRIERG